MEKKQQTFEEYLRDDVWEAEGVLDDAMPDVFDDAFDDWCRKLDVQEVMDYAQEWGDKITKRKVYCHQCENCRKENTAVLECLDDNCPCHSEKV